MNIQSSISSSHDIKKNPKQSKSKKQLAFKHEYEYEWFQSIQK